MISVLSSRGRDSILRPLVLKGCESIGAWLYRLQVVMGTLVSLLILEGVRMGNSSRPLNPYTYMLLCSVCWSCEATVCVYLPYYAYLHICLRGYLTDVLRRLLPTAQTHISTLICNHIYSLHRPVFCLIRRCPKILIAHISLELTFAAFVDMYNVLLLFNIRSDI